MEGHQCLGQLPQRAGPRGTGHRGSGAGELQRSGRGALPTLCPHLCSAGATPPPSCPCPAWGHGPNCVSQGRPAAASLQPGVWAGLASSSPTPTPEPAPVGGPKCVYFPDLFSNKKEKGRRWRGGLAGPGAPHAPRRDGPHSACGVALEDWGGSMGFGGKQGQTLPLVSARTGRTSGRPGNGLHPPPIRTNFWLPRSRSRCVLTAGRTRDVTFLILLRFLLISTKKALRVSKAGS